MFNQNFNIDNFDGFYGLFIFDTIYVSYMLPEFQRCTDFTTENLK